MSAKDYATPTATYDADADALYVPFSAAEVVETVNLDDLRLVDDATDRSVVGLEFIDASQGVDLREVPFAEEVERTILSGQFTFPLFV